MTAERGARKKKDAGSATVRVRIGRHRSALHGHCTTGIRLHAHTARPRERDPGDVRPREARRNGRSRLAQCRSRRRHGAGRQRRVEPNSASFRGRPLVSRVGPRCGRSSPSSQCRSGFRQSASRRHPRFRTSPSRAPRDTRCTGASSGSRTRYSHAGDCEKTRRWPRWLSRFRSRYPLPVLAHIRNTARMIAGPSSMMIAASSSLNDIRPDGVIRNEDIILPICLYS